MIWILFTKKKKDSIKTTIYNLFFLKETTIYNLKSYQALSYSESNNLDSVPDNTIFDTIIQKFK